MLSNKEVWVWQEKKWKAFQEKKNLEKFILKVLPKILLPWRAEVVT